jgi:nucleoside-diphosphate-sugar epimerase
MLEIASLAATMTGADSSLIKIVDPPSIASRSKHPSSERLRSLGWVPTVDLEEGMCITLDYLKDIS